MNDPRNFDLIENRLIFDIDSYIGASLIHRSRCIDHSLSDYMMLRFWLVTVFTLFKFFPNSNSNPIWSPRKIAFSAKSANWKQCGISANFRGHIIIDYVAKQIVQMTLVRCRCTFRKFHENGARSDHQSMPMCRWVGVTMPMQYIIIIMNESESKKERNNKNAEKLKVKLTFMVRVTQFLMIFDSISLL